MSDDMLLHLSSNSSNQSDQSLPSKIARLEARMISKGSSGPTVSTPGPANWPSVSSVANFRPAVIPTPVEDLADPLLSSDSDDDDDVSLNFCLFSCITYHSCFYPVTHVWQTMPYDLRVCLVFYG